VFRSHQCYGSFRFVGEEWSGSFAERVLTPAIEDAFVPRSIGFGRAKGGLGSRAGWPDISTEGGELSGCGATGGGGVALDDGVDEYEGAEETWVHEREVGEHVASEGVPNADDGKGHAESVDHV